MKSLVNLLFCVSTWINAEAKQPLQPVIIDGHKFEWKAASLPAHDLSIGVVRSFLTNDFLYVSIEDIASNSILNFGRNRF